MALGQAAMLLISNTVASAEVESLTYGLPRFHPTLLWAWLSGIQISRNFNEITMFQKPVIAGNKNKKTPTTQYLNRLLAEI